jgi:DDE_Tnp_1-associated
LLVYKLFQKALQGFSKVRGGIKKTEQPCSTGKNLNRSQKARKPTWTISPVPRRVNELPTSLEEVDAQSVYAAFENITDGRCKRGRRDTVALILTLIVVAKLMGEPKLSGVSQWARLRGTWLNEAVHLERKQWPAASTYTYVLERLDAQEGTRVMHQCLTRAETSRRCGDEPSRLATQAGAEHSAQIAMDGKTMRGTLGHEAPRQESVHLLSLYARPDRNGVSPACCRHEGEREQRRPAVSDP